MALITLSMPSFGIPLVPKDLAVYLDILRRQDLFERLGCSRDEVAPKERIERNFQILSHALDPERYSGEERELAAEGQLLVREAYDTISTEKGQEEYIKSHPKDLAESILGASLGRQILKLSSDIAGHSSALFQDSIFPASKEEVGPPIHPLLEVIREDLKSLRSVSTYREANDIVTHIEESIEKLQSDGLSIDEIRRAFDGTKLAIGVVYALVLLNKNPELIERVEKSLGGDIYGLVHSSAEGVARGVLWAKLNKIAKEPYASVSEGLKELEEGLSSIKKTGIKDSDLIRIINNRVGKIYVDALARVIETGLDSRFQEFTNVIGRTASQGVLLAIHQVLKGLKKAEDTENWTVKKVAPERVRGLAEILLKHVRLEEVKDTPTLAAVVNELGSRLDRSGDEVLAARLASEFPVIGA